MTEARWLDEQEQRAWRSLTAMQEGLSEFIDRQLRTRCGLSIADYQVLAHLSEAPEGRLRPFELGGLLRWEKSRLSQHLTRMEGRGLVIVPMLNPDGVEIALHGAGSAGKLAESVAEIQRCNPGKKWSANARAVISSGGRVRLYPPCAPEEPVTRWASFNAEKRLSRYF